MLDSFNILETLKIPICLILIIFLIILSYLIKKLLIFFKIDYILNYNLLTCTKWDDN